MSDIKYERISMKSDADTLGPFEPSGNITINSSSYETIIMKDLNITGTLKIKDVDINDRLQIFNDIPTKALKLKDLKIMINAWITNVQSNKGGFDDEMFTISYEGNEWILINHQYKSNQLLISSGDIQVCLEYLFLLFKYSANDIIDFDEWYKDALFGILIQPTPNSKPFAIYKFKRNELNEKDFISRIMMFIKDRYDNLFKNE